MGCLNSKSGAATNDTNAMASVVSSNHPTISERHPKRLSLQEVEDVMIIFQILKTENLDVYVTACVFNSLFKKHEEVKQMFLKSAFLDPEHKLEHATDPWLQGFLKAFINYVIKFATLQNDEIGIKIFMLEMKDAHQRVNGIQEEHLEIMIESLYQEILFALGKILDNRQKKSLKHFLELLRQSAMIFLSIDGDYVMNTEV